MNRLLAVLIITPLLHCCINPEVKKEDMNVTGVAKPVISLNGIWKITLDPPEKFYENETADTTWRNIVVPGECAMQGFAIRHNKPFVYQKIFKVPEDYTGMRIKLRFEGVYSYARIWINGTFIREHNGGFTQWDCDITKYVKPGKEAKLLIEVTDKDDDVSYASGYAKHQIGGILRNVSLLALPENFPEQISIQTDLDNKYIDADLRIKVKSNPKDKTWINFRLYDMKGVVVNMSDKKFLLKDSVTNISLQVRKPEKWDAEHPNLYTLIAFVYDRRKVIASVSTRIGFRKIEVRGNKLLVNGQQVKLRGACRHDIDPLLGRMSTNENDKNDVLLAKEANINFIRTSHYPPAESFLEYCDEYGLYVEEETAVCFMDTYRGGIYKLLKQSGKEYEPEMLSQLNEMVSNHQNHPSVIIWSIGNENVYNDSFRKSYQLVKSIDKTRPVMFSYPGGVPDTVKCFDIVSLHYPSYNGNIDQRGIKVNKFNSVFPAIYDEWAHIPCYNKPEILEDKNVRNFWGQSLDSMWTNVYESDGGIGGAIWGMIDETFMLPDTMSGQNKWWGIQEETNGIKLYEGPDVGYGEWGITDTWRRKKPEFWNTKKAYSPIKILISEITDFKANRPLQIPVQNRFNHTNLREIITKWTYRGKEHIALKHNIEPFNKGKLQLFPSDWTEGEYVKIKFFTNDSMLVDEYNLRLGKREAKTPQAEPGNIKTFEIPGGKIRIEGKDFSAQFDKNRGILENVISNNDTLIKSGPWIHFRYPAMKHRGVVPMAEIGNEWKVEKVNYEIRDGSVNIISGGKYDKLIVKYNIKIYADGTFTFVYNINGIPDKSQAEELGLKFLTGNCFDSLYWDRKSFWNAYPEDHIGSPTGSVSLARINYNTYRMKPSGSWEFDNSSFYYNGLGISDGLSFIAGSMKENIYSYTLSTPGRSEITVYSAAAKACRIAKTGNSNYLYINKLWDYNSLMWGNYFKNQVLPAEVSDTVYLKIN